MAIKGYLNDIKFVEVLRIIGKHNGRLGIWNFSEGKQYECFFQDAKIIYLNFNGVNIQNVDELKKVILDLSSDDKSYYAFQNDTAPVYTPPIISVSELLEYSLSQTVGSFNNEDDLPNLQTKFETVNKLNFPLQGELEDFWNKSIGMLHEGCSGYDICNAFNYSEREVQEALYKLRTTGLIKPVRVFKAVNPALRTKMLSRNLNRIANRNNPELRQSQKELVGAGVESANAVSQPVNLTPEMPVSQPQVSYSQPVSQPGYMKNEPPAYSQQPQMSQPALPVVETAPPTAPSYEAMPPVAAEQPLNSEQSYAQPNPAQQNNYNPLPSTVSNSQSNSRGGLIKRMLNSLFR